MKKSYFALALCGLAGAASAQSTITIYGIADIAITSGTGSLSSRLQEQAAGQSSRIGFKGVEDLGGGMSAGFNLEGQIAYDDGTGGAANTNNQPGGAVAAAGLNFARRATVSIYAPWGEIRTGRDYSSQYRNRVEVDPFYSLGVASIQPFAASQGGVVSTRVSNFVGYYLPEGLGGLYGQAQIYLGENATNAANKNDGSGQNFRLGWLFGNGLNISVSAARTSYQATATAGDIITQNIGVQYPIGPVRLLGGYFKDTIKRSTTDLPFTGWTLGGIWGVGQENLKFALSQYGQTTDLRPGSKKLSLGWEHVLSKRTLLYVNAARLNNSGGAANALNGSTTGANTSSTGWDLGIRHTF